jgi:hypothetical protein
MNVTGLKRPVGGKNYESAIEKEWGLLLTLKGDLCYTVNYVQILENRISERLVSCDESR